MTENFGILQGSALAEQSSGLNTLCSLAALFHGLLCVLLAKAAFMLEELGSASSVH